MSEIKNIIYHSHKKNSKLITCDNSECDYEEEQLFNQRKIAIFDKYNKNTKILVGFQGVNCDVTLSIGGIPIKCSDHIISCNFRHSHIHSIDLIVEPKNNIENWSVKIFWTNTYLYTTVVTDETLNEIMATIVYAYCGIGVNYELHEEKNMLKKILKELSLKSFLEDSIKEQKVIDIINLYYRGLK